MKPRGRKTLVEPVRQGRMSTVLNQPSCHSFFFRMALPVVVVIVIFFSHRMGLQDGPPPNIRHKIWDLSSIFNARTPKRETHPVIFGPANTSLGFPSVFPVGKNYACDTMG